MYKHTNFDTLELHHGDGQVTVITPDPKSGEYRRYLEWVATGNTAAAADPLPEPEPTRDDRLTLAVEKANETVDTALDDSPDFTPRQKVVLKTILKGAFNKLGAAVRGEPL